MGIVQQNTLKRQFMTALSQVLRKNRVSQMIRTDIQHMRLPVYVHDLYKKLIINYKNNILSYFLALTVQIRNATSI